MENLDNFVFILGTHMCVCVFSPSPQREGSLILRRTGPLNIGFDLLIRRHSENFEKNTVPNNIFCMYKSAKSNVLPFYQFICHIWDETRYLLDLF